MTRGREHNVAHLVAEDLDDARQQWIETFGRDRADLGPTHAAQRAAEDLERYAPHRPLESALGDLRTAWTTEQDLRGALARCESFYDFMAADGEPPTAWAADNRAEKHELRDQLTTANQQVRALLHEPAIRSLPPGRIEQEHAGWLQDRRDEQQEAQAIGEPLTHPRPGRNWPPSRYPNAPDPGRGISR